jgi:hypothetical protein
MGQLLSSLLDIFYTKKLDIVVIGLENRYVMSDEEDRGFEGFRVYRRGDYLVVDRSCCRLRFDIG